MYINVMAELDPVIHPSAIGSRLSRALARSGADGRVKLGHDTVFRD